MELDGQQQKQLQAALISAFPTRSDLEQMVFHGLDVHLAAIIAEGSLQQVVFELLRWAQAHGRVEALIQAALSSNGGNQQLQDVARQLLVSRVVATMPSIWNIPYPRNPFFTGQEDVLMQLSTTLKAGQATALSQPLAISGLGGIGKTQIALEFAYRHRQEYQAVFWVLADTRERLLSSYIAVAQMLSLPQRSEQDQAVIVQAVVRWLQTHGSWLLILDNADELTMVREFLPATFGGHLLITTRARATGTQAHRIEVEVMPDDVGALFLLHRAKLVALDVPLARVNATDVTIAREICQELGGLPLALDQAGAYIEEVECSLLDYQQRYRNRRTLLLNRRGNMASDHPLPVAATWSLAFEKIEQHDAVAADLLRLCAFLSPDAIAEEIIVQGASHLGPSLALIAEDDVALDEAIAPLLAYSLVRRDRSEKTLSMHRLVQAVLRDGMDEIARREWAHRAMLSVNAAFPNVDPIEPSTWPQAERLLPQAFHLILLIEQYQMKSLQAGRLLRQTASYLQDHARYAEAEPLFERALRIFEQGLELGHLQMVLTLHGLADVYRDQEKYSLAEPLYQNALHMIEQQLGRTHPEMIAPLHGLAHIATARGEYEQAESLYEDALRIWEEQMGGTHAYGAYLLKGLAGLCREQGKYVEAESFYQRALHIWEQQRGEMHPQTAYALKGLADLYREQGRYIEAEELYQRALHIRQTMLGPDNSVTAEVMQSYAQLREAQGKCEEAMSLYNSTLVIREQTLGPHHPKTAQTRKCLITLLHAMGQHE